MIKKSLFVITASAMALAAPAMAQDKGPAKAATSSSTSPMLVVDTAGEHVATVLGMSETMFKIQTDKHIIELPSSSFAFGEDGNFILALSQAELNAEYEAGIRAIEESVSVGAPVVDVDLVAAGTIEAMDDETATIRLVSGKVVRVPLNGITKRAEGAILGYRNADLEPLGVEMSPEQVQEQARLEAEIKAQEAAAAGAAGGASAADDAAAQ